MKLNQATTNLNSGNRASAGFTLIEMLIAMVVSMIIIAAIYTSYQIQQKAYTVQRELARMENCLRAAAYIMKEDILNSGRNEAMDGTIGILNSSNWSGTFPGLVMNTGLDLGTSKNGGALTDNVPDSKADVSLGPAAIQTIQYRLIMDPTGGAQLQLIRIDSRSPTAGGDLICDSMEDMAFAFAIDADRDEDIDRMPPTAGGGQGNIIWAADVDNDTRLDTNLDADNSGTITAADGAGIALGTTVSLRRARAVRIWLLARAARPDPNYFNNQTYQVGYKTITPNDNFRRLLLSTTVTLRNRER